MQLVGTRLINDRQTGQSKGFGYVEFGTPEEVSVLYVILALDWFVHLFEFLN